MPAGTYTPQAAINLVQNIAHGVPLDAVKANICDMVYSMIWHYYPWPWTVKSLTAINLVNNQQDYNPTDTDILRPLKVRIVRTDTSPNEFRELSFLNNLSPELTRTGGIDTMKAIAWYAGSNVMRFDLAVSVGTNQTLQLQGEYQSQPTRITDGNMNSVFPTPDASVGYPDRYFNVFVEGVAWQVYRLSDDPRAGTIQVAKNGTAMKEYTGQLGIFMEALMQMSRTEDLGNGDQFQWPDNPLGVGRSYWPGLFGL